MGLTYVGKQNHRDLLNGTSSLPLTHFMWGAGSPLVAFLNSQTALGSELFPSGNGTLRNAFYGAVRVDNFTNIFPDRLETDQLNGGSLTEVGLATASSGPIMELRQSFNSVLKSSGLRILTDYYVEVVRR